MASPARRPAPRREATEGFGPGVPKVVSHRDGDTFRTVCTVRFESAIYVLRAFRNRARRGIATPKEELDPVSRRLRAAERRYLTRIVGTDAMKPTDTALERGSVNVFADLGLTGADARPVKAEPVSRIDDIVHDRGIAQTEAGRLMGLSQPDVSRLLGGDFREYSLERLAGIRRAISGS